MNVIAGCLAWLVLLADLKIPDGYQPYACDEDMDIWNMLWENSEGKDMTLLTKMREDLRVAYGR